MLSWRREVRLLREAGAPVPLMWRWDVSRFRGALCLKPLLCPQSWQTGQDMSYVTHVLAHLSVGWWLPLCSHNFYCIPTTSTSPCHQPPLAQLVPIPYATSFYLHQSLLPLLDSPDLHPLPSPPCHICSNPDGLCHLLHTAATSSSSSIPPYPFTIPFSLAIWPTPTEHAYLPPYAPTSSTVPHHIRQCPPPMPGSTISSVFPPPPPGPRLFNVPTGTAWPSSPFCSQQLSPISSGRLSCIPYNLTQHTCYGCLL